MIFTDYMLGLLTRNLQPVVNSCANVCADVAHDVDPTA